jgi:vitamin B12 transporter
MTNRVRWAVSACLVLTTSVHAADSDDSSLLDEVFVSATRSADGLPRGLLGASLSIIDPVDLEYRQTRVVSDVLRDIPGISVSRAGAVGGLTQIRIRGTEGNHTLVMIDGIKASDPSAGEFDFATLIADNMARVEVLRGQQSALYGSDAIGGVINYTTLSGREAAGVSARIEGGSFGSFDGSARLGGVSGMFDYAINAGWQTTDGYPTSRFGTRDVGSENSTLSGKFNFEFSDVFRLKSVLRASQTEADSNDQSFAFGTPTYGFVIDSDDTYKNKTLLGLVRAEFDAIDGRLKSAVSVQGLDSQRDGYSGGARASGSEGSRLKASAESTLRLGERETVEHLITAAVDYEDEEFQNTGPGINAAQALKRSNDNTGLVAQYNLLANERLGLGASVRHDRNDRFDNVTTYRGEGSYRFESNTRIRAATGSGIKNPTSTELFGFNPNTFIGNPNLRPEKSKGWEAGVDQELLGGQVLLGATYFDNELEDEIFTTFSPTFVSSPANRTTLSKQKGVELTAEARVARVWRISAAYTHLDAKENNVEEVRRPKDIASLNVGWRAPSDRFGVNLTARYNGEMLDSNFTGVGPARIPLEAYTLVNLGADFQLTEQVQLYGRVENLLDEEYEEVYTYATPGTAGYVGVRVKF